MIELLTSPRLYWLMRIGWLERIIFLAVRWFMFRFARPTKLRVLLHDLFGFDFSKWQEAIDFARVLAYGAKYIILRASYGLTADERFVEYMQTAPQFFEGRLSVYGYYYPHLDPVAQARKLLEVIAPYRRYILRVWGDFEFTNSGAYASSTHWKTYAQTIIDAGYKFGVYTRKTWWDSRVGTLASWFGQFPGWFAQYAPELTLIPRGWIKGSLWQKGTPAIGHEVGTVSREVDLNIADDEFYRSEYGALPPPPNGGNMSQWYRVNTTALNIRSGPGSNNADIGDLLYGDRIEVEAVIVNGWLPIKTILRNNGDVETIPNAWCSGAYCVQTEPPVTPPPPSNELPDSWEVTQVAKDENGNTLATYKGTLTRQ